MKKPFRNMSWQMVGMGHTRRQINHRCCVVLFFACSGVAFATTAKAVGEGEDSWIEEIEKIFIPSEQCKQCHDRHYEEWKGMREQTMDLKTFGRVDGALLHGTALTSPVFKTVLGLWLQTKPDQAQRTRCLSCHAPAVTVFPQHTDRIIGQVMKGGKQVKVEGISCSACHLITGTTGKLPMPIRPSRLKPGQPCTDPMPNRMKILSTLQDKRIFIEGPITAPHVISVR